MATVPTLVTPGGTLEPRVWGEAIVYRLYDVGYAIQLDQASELLASSAPERPRPVRGEAQAIQIPNPPVTVGLGSETLTIGGEAREVELSAWIFDFGVVSLRARVPAPEGLPWSGFATFGDGTSAGPAWTEVFAQAKERLLARIAPAIDRAGQAPVTEDYVVFRVNRLEDDSGARLSSDTLRDEDIARLLLGEPRPVSAAARKDLLSQRFSYFEDDLTVLTWGHRARRRAARRGHRRSVRARVRERTAARAALLWRGARCRDTDDLYPRRRSAPRLPPAGPALQPAARRDADPRRGRHRVGRARRERAQGHRRCVPRAHLCRGARGVSRPHLA